VLCAVACAPAYARTDVPQGFGKTHVLTERNPCWRAACKARVARKHKRAYVRPYRGWLYRTRMCESGGNYAINTGNGFYGAYQFTLQSWRGVGGQGFPHRNPPLEQDYRAVRLLRLSGPGNWPVCGH
jgi:hypothetical protein